MSSRSWRGRIGVVVMVVASGAWLSLPAAAQAPAKAPAAAAQAPPRAPGPGEVATDPIACWWKTDTNAVQLGEHFVLTLTCGVVETSRLTVVPDVKSIEPTTVQLAPFEVVRGVRHEDIREGPWRYFQYEYTLRLLGEGYFGQDVDIPSLNVTYNIQSPGGGETQGRDQLYALPAVPMRIMSLAPTKATDIRDAPRDTFADIEARKFRATGEIIAASVFFAFAVVLLGFAVARMVGRYRQHAPVVARPLPARTVLAGCLHAIGRLKSDVAREGWTHELASRALAILRIAGAVALGRPVSQTRVDTNVQGREGQIVLRRGVFRSKRALISAPTTEDAIASLLAGANAPDARARAMLEELRDSLHTFSTACYSRNGKLETTGLDAALENGRRAIRRLRFTKRWPMSTATRLAKSAAGLGGMAWSRSENS